jgi:hypothetical protein
MTAYPVMFGITVIYEGSGRLFSRIPQHTAKLYLSKSDSCVLNLRRPSLAH